MNPTDFITCEIFFNGKSYGHATWCPHCQKGFSNDDNKKICPHCGAEIKNEAAPQ